MAGLRVLILESYPPEVRQALRDAGASEAGDLYLRMLGRLDPSLEMTRVYAADAGQALPDRDGLAAFDGVAWTGSSLTVYHHDDPRVTRQLDLARDILAVGLPVFGTCWAAQVAVVAVGGAVRPSPRGREYGVSRRIRLTAAGRAHPMFAGKPAEFDAFTSHRDEVCDLGGATALAGNDWCAVQAASVDRPAGAWWTLQYHPEYDLHEVAALGQLRIDELVAQGAFPSRAAGDRWLAELDALHADPTDVDRADRLGVSPALMDVDQRTIEARNWLRALHAQAGTSLPEAGSGGSADPVPGDP